MNKIVPIKAFWYLAGFLSAILFFFAATLYMAGVVYSEVPEKASVEDEMLSVDVIACLTGGKGRIKKAFALYEKGYGKVLYISGIAPNVDFKDVLKELKLNVPPMRQDGIIIDKVARNTIENAVQVREFMMQRKLGSVLVVTSSYHARRAYFTFSRLLPKPVKLEVIWHEQEPFDKNNWRKSWNGILVTVTEFFKFFYAWVKLPEGGLI